MILRVPLEGLAAGVRDLPAEAAAYVTRVHRLGPGARLLAFDPALGLEADGEIVAVDARRATVTLGPPRATTARPTRPVTLIQGIGKGDKLDAIVRDATELGATRVVPAVAARSVRRPEPGRESRWRRIALEAARQCGRGDVPIIGEVTSLIDAVRAHAPRDAALGAALHPDGDVALGTAFSPLTPDCPVILIVGPEGGLAPEEVAAARATGFVIASLGAFVLRTETAAAAALGALLAAPR